MVSNNKPGDQKLSIEDYPGFENKPDWEQEVILKAIKKRKRKRFANLVSLSNRPNQT